MLGARAAWPRTAGLQKTIADAAGTIITLRGRQMVGPVSCRCALVRVIKYLTTEFGRNKRAPRGAPEQQTHHCLGERANERTLSVRTRTGIPNSDPPSVIVASRDVSVGNFCWPSWGISLSLSLAARGHMGQLNAGLHIVRPG